jgi:uncharacterized membrane protein YgcG
MSVSGPPSFVRQNSHRLAGRTDTPSDSNEQTAFKAQTKQKEKGVSQFDAEPTGWWRWLEDAFRSAMAFPWHCAAAVLCIAVGCFFWQHKETTIEWVGAALQQLNDWGDMLFHGWWPAWASTYTSKFSEEEDGTCTRTMIFGMLKGIRKDATSWGADETHDFARVISKVCPGASFSCQHDQSRAWQQEFHTLNEVMKRQFDPIVGTETFGTWPVGFALLSLIPMSIMTLRLLMRDFLPRLGIHKRVPPTSWWAWALSFVFALALCGRIAVPAYRMKGVCKQLEAMHSEHFDTFRKESGLQIYEPPFHCYFDRLANSPVIYVLFSVWSVLSKAQGLLGFLFPLLISRLVLGFSLSILSTKLKLFWQSPYKTIKHKLKGKLIEHMQHRTHCKVINFSLNICNRPCPAQPSPNWHGSELKFRTLAEKSTLDVLHDDEALFEQLKTAARWTLDKHPFLHLLGTKELEKINHVLVNELSEMFGDGFLLQDCCERAGCQSEIQIERYYIGLTKERSANGMVFSKIRCMVVHETLLRQLKDCSSTDSNLKLLEKENHHPTFEKKHFVDRWNTLIEMSRYYHTDEEEEKLRQDAGEEGYSPVLKWVELAVQVPSLDGTSPANAPDRGSAGGSRSSDGGSSSGGSGGGGGGRQTRSGANPKSKALRRV